MPKPLTKGQFEWKFCELPQDTLTLAKAMIILYFLKKGPSGIKNFWNVPDLKL